MFGNDLTMRGLLKSLRRRWGGEKYDQLSFAHPYCALEVIAEKMGRQATKGLTTETAGFENISEALCDLIDDDEGSRALFKALHRAIEDRSRLMAVVLDSPEKHGYGEIHPDPGPHPLDQFCAAALAAAAAQPDIPSRLHHAGWKLKPTFLGEIGSRVKIFLAIVFVTWRSVSILLRQGTTRIEPYRTNALLENFSGPELFEALAGAAQDAGYTDPDQFAMFVERDNKLPKMGYKFLYPDRLKVSRSEWWNTALLPTWRLAIRMIPYSVIGKRETRFAAFEALRLASKLLSLWPKAMNIRCKTIADNVDYGAESALKGAVFRKYGSKMVRWPGTEIETYGSLLSSSAHDHFVSGGNYLSDTFSGNWRAPKGAIPIGLIQFDRRLASSALVAPDLRECIEQLHQDKKMMVYFGSGTETNMAPFIARVFRAVVEIFSTNPDWFLVVKSKRWTSFMNLVRSQPEFSQWEKDERIIFIDYGNAPEKEICSSGWLAETMDLGTGYFGSTLGECAGRGRPYCTHLPVVYDTPFMRRLVENEVVVTDLAAFKTRLAEAMRGNAPTIPADWGKWAYDPYQDDRALERLSAILMGDVDAYLRHPAGVALVQ